MGSEKRTQLQQNVVEALLDSKAIDVGAVASVFEKYGEEALRRGDYLATVINEGGFWACGNPGPVFNTGRMPAQDLQG